jgi:hypothetical protein
LRRGDSRLAALPLLVATLAALAAVPRATTDSWLALRVDPSPGGTESIQVTARPVLGSASPSTWTLSVGRIETRRVHHAAAWWVSSTTPWVWLEELVQPRLGPADPVPMLPLPAALVVVAWGRGAPSAPVLDFELLGSGRSGMARCRGVGSQLACKVPAGRLRLFPRSLGCSADPVTILVGPRQTKQAPPLKCSGRAVVRGELGEKVRDISRVTLRLIPLRERMERAGLLPDRSRALLTKADPQRRFMFSLDVSVAGYYLVEAANGLGEQTTTAPFFLRAGEEHLLPIPLLLDAPPAGSLTISNLDAAKPIYRAYGLARSLGGDLGYELHPPQDGRVEVAETAPGTWRQLPAGNYVAWASMGTFEYLHSLKVKDEPQHVELPPKRVEVRYDFTPVPLVMSIPEGNRSFVVGRPREGRPVMAVDARLLKVLPPLVKGDPVRAEVIQEHWRRLMPDTPFPSDIIVPRATLEGSTLSMSLFGPESLQLVGRSIGDLMPSLTQVWSFGNVAKWAYRIGDEFAVSSASLGTSGLDVVAENRLQASPPVHVERGDFAPGNPPILVLARRTPFRGRVVSSRGGTAGALVQASPVNPSAAPIYPTVTDSAGNFELLLGPDSQGVKLAILSPEHGYVDYTVDGRALDAGEALLFPHFPAVREVVAPSSSEPGKAWFLVGPGRGVLPVAAVQIFLTRNRRIVLGHAVAIPIGEEDGLTFCAARTRWELFRFGGSQCVPGQRRARTGTMRD